MTVTKTNKTKQTKTNELRSLLDLSKILEDKIQRKERSNIFWITSSSVSLTPVQLRQNDHP